MTHLLDFDAETGLHYNRSRYYDPDAGRFISQDPPGPAGGINLYQYAPNPLFVPNPTGGTSQRGTIGNTLMNVINGNMWNDGRKVMLSRLLEYIPPNKWVWYLYEIDAVAVALYEMSMQHFEEKALSSETGIKLSWDEVMTLADSLEDINNLFLAALLKPLDYNSLCSVETGSCLALLTVSDSTSWEVKIL
ncbi:RHS repeat-associated core domain-containing protein [Cronobacter dublinensis]